MQMKLWDPCSTLCRALRGGYCNTFFGGWGSGRDDNLGLREKPSYSSPTYPWFQLPAVDCGPEADANPPDVLSGQCYITVPTSFIALCLIMWAFISSHHPKKKDECSNNHIYWERNKDHMHTTFITVYCYNCSILLLVISVNLTVPNLSICILNFIIGRYV